MKKEIAIPVPKVPREAYLRYHTTRGWEAGVRRQ